MASRPADAASAICVLVSDAKAPQQTLPSAMLACDETRFIANARARTHPGAVLCVAADRLANTETHAMPAVNDPTTAKTVMPVTATSSIATDHRTAPLVTTALSERRWSWRGIDSAPTTAPTPKPAESKPKPPAPSPNWSRAITGSSAQNALAQMPKLRLRMTSARMALE